MVMIGYQIFGRVYQKEGMENLNFGPQEGKGFVKRAAAPPPHFILIISIFFHKTLKV